MIDEKKLIERFEELTHDNPMVTDNYVLRKDAIEIINQLAEEYLPEINVGNIDGWIPCSDRKPTKDMCNIDGEYYCNITAYDDFHEEYYAARAKYIPACNKWYKLTAIGERTYAYRILSDEVVAWRELPAPYQPKGE